MPSIIVTASRQQSDSKLSGFLPALKPNISHRRPSPLNCIEKYPDRYWFGLLLVAASRCVSVFSFVDLV